jgi:Ca2+/Na+ antiporter
MYTLSLCFANLGIIVGLCNLFLGVSYLARNPRVISPSFRRLMVFCLCTGILCMSVSLYLGKLLIVPFHP